MSSFMICFLLWIVLFHKQEGTIIRLDHNKRVRDGIDYVMHKYLNPLRKLTADLPNHAIEMQIEIQDSIPSGSTQKPQRRVIRVINSRHPKTGLVKRSQDLEASVAPEAAAAAAAATSSTAATPAPDVVPPPAMVAVGAVPAAPPAAASAAPAPAVPMAVDAAKMPVYMEDLKKALDELEKKLSTTPESTTMMTTSGDTPCNGGGGAGGTNPLQTPVRSIDDIVQLLKKAIHVEHRMPKPSDDNLEWVQIKIPKNMK